MARATRALTVAAAVGLAALWLYAAVPKLEDPGELLAAVKSYRLLPHPAAAWAAVWLPWVEIGTAVLLLVPRWRVSGFLLTALLMGMFTVAIAQAWLRGFPITCGCFGGPATESHADFAWLVVRDLLLAGIALAGLRASLSGSTAR